MKLGRISGSLTNTTDGKSYLVAGSGISIASASSGQVTISTAPSLSPIGTYCTHNMLLWEELSGKTIPGVRRAQAYTVVNDKAYIFGGYDAVDAATNTIYTASLSDLTTWGTSPNTLPYTCAYVTTLTNGSNLWQLFRPPSTTLNV